MSYTERDIWHQGGVDVDYSAVICDRLYNITDQEKEKVVLYLLVSVLFEKWSVDFSTDHFLLFVIYFTSKIKISCDELRKLLLMNDLVLTFGKNVFGKN